MTYSHLRLTACTPGSAPVPTLDDEYGEPLPFLVYVIITADSDEVMNNRWRVSSGHGGC